MDKKRCPSCKKDFYLPEKNFNKDKSRKDGLSCYCKDCARKDYKYYASLKQKPLVLKECGYLKCTNTFKTRSHKKYCCPKHASLAYIENKGKEKVVSRQNAIRKIRRKKSNNSNKGKTWTQKDIVYAIKNRQNGKSWVKIGENLGRSGDACANKIKPLLESYFL